MLSVLAPRNTWPQKLQGNGQKKPSYQKHHMDWRKVTGSGPVNSSFPQWFSLCEWHSAHTCRVRFRSSATFEESFMILQKLRLAKNGAAVDPGSKRLFFFWNGPGQIDPQTANIFPRTLSDVIWRYLTLSDEHHSPKTSQTYPTLSDAIWRWGPREAIVSRAHEGPIWRYLTGTFGGSISQPIWRYLTGTRWWIHQPIWCYLTDPFPRVLCHQPPNWCYLVDSIFIKGLSVNPWINI
jgi:hypothetical protein